MQPTKGDNFGKNIYKPSIWQGQQATLRKLCVTVKTRKRWKIKSTIYCDYCAFWVWLGSEYVYIFFADCVVRISDFEMSL